jgi:hypothetical protein
MTDNIRNFPRQEEPKMPPNFKYQVELNSGVPGVTKSLVFMVIGLASSNQRTPFTADAKLALLFGTFTNVPLPIAYSKTPKGLVLPELLIATNPTLFRIIGLVNV